MKVIEEVIRGNRWDPKNPFHWDQVVCNLPSDWNYEPSHPYVYKGRPDGHIAGDLFTYIDDQRITAPSEWGCWLALQKNSTLLTFQGIQTASRKRRPVRTRVGAWAGLVVHSDQHCLRGMITQEKWDKMKGILVRIQAELSEAKKVNPTSPQLSFKQLEKDRGFFIYTLRCYPGSLPLFERRV